MGKNKEHGIYFDGTYTKDKARKKERATHGHTRTGRARASS